MNRSDVLLAVFIGACVLGATALFLALTSAAAHGTVFDVTTDDAFLMHHEQARP